MYHAPVPVHVTTLACAEVGAVDQGAVRGSQRIRGQRLCGRPIRVLHQGLQRARLLADYFTYYNNHGPHQQLDGLTPAHLYFGLPDTRSRTLVPNLIHPQFTLTTA
jgi:hypothetical protein